MKKNIEGGSSNVLILAKQYLPIEVDKGAYCGSKIRTYKIRSDFYTRGELEEELNGDIDKEIGNSDGDVDGETIEYRAKVRGSSDSKVQIEWESIDIEAIQIVLYSGFNGYIVVKTIAYCANDTEITHAEFKGRSSYWISSAQPDSKPVRPIILRGR